MYALIKSALKNFRKKNSKLVKRNVIEERDLWGGLGVDGRTILEWTLKR